MMNERARYSYTEADGTPKYEMIRYEPKTFRARRVDGHGGHTWGLGDIERLPYRLPELREGIAAGRTILVLEGEKDVDAARAVNICATTSCGGAAWRWDEAFVSYFKGAGCVVIIPDCDEPGRNAAKERAAALLAVVDDVRFIDIGPDRNDGYDISDWLADGHQARELKPIIEAAPRFVPPIALPNGLKQTAAPRVPASFVRVGELLSEVDDETPLLIEAIGLRCGSTALIASKPKVGKTSLLLNGSVAVARGIPFLGHPVKQGPVLYVALEGNRSEWRRVLRAMGATEDDPFYIFIGQAPQDAMRWLRESAEKYKPVLIVVDTLQRLARLKDMNDYAAVTNASEPLVEIAQTFNAALVLAHHAKKNSDGDDGDSVLGSTALYGFVDTLVVLKKGAEGRRTIKTSQRYGDDLEETVLTIDSQTKLLAIAGARSGVDRAECEASIVAAASSARRWLERGDLLDDIEARKQTKNAALQQVLDDGRLARIGGGKRGDPYLYALPGSPLSDEEETVEKFSGSRGSALYAEPETGNRNPPSHKGLFAPQPLSFAVVSGTTNGAPEFANQGTAGTTGTTNVAGVWDTIE